MSLYILLFKNHNIIGDYMLYVTITIKSIVFTIIISSLYHLFSRTSIHNFKNIDLILILFILNLSIYGIFSEIDFSYFLLIIVVIVTLRMIYYWIKSRKDNQTILNEDKVIISRGKLNFKELVKNDLNLNYLLLELKKKKIKNLEEVELAFFTNHELIVFKRNNNVVYPIPIIVDGVIFEDTLKQINKNRKWLYDNLHDKNITLENIIYGFYKNDQIVLIQKGELL